MDGDKTLEIKTVLCKKIIPNLMKKNKNSDKIQYFNGLEKHLIS